MADDIAVTLLLTRDGIDVTSEIVGGRILNAPAGDYVATWTASDGVLPSVIKTESLTAEEPPSGQVPTVIGSIADRTYTVGQSVPATDLRTKFEGATSYVISPALNWVYIDGYNLIFDTAAALEATAFSVRGVNADGQSEPVMFNLTVNVADQAPSVQTSPTITGSTTVGSILTRTAGTATGIPTPSRATVWLRNGTGEANIIPGQTGNTLDTSGFAADDVITTRDDWTNSQGTASGTSAPWTLTVQPAITATVPALIASQQASIPFNTTPDSVTVTQGGGALTVAGDGATRSFTPLTTEPVTIRATKAGWTTFLEDFDVAPAPETMVLDGPTNTLQFPGVTSASEPFTLSLTGTDLPAAYTGARTITPSQMASGPVAHTNPFQTGTGTVGEDVTLDPGLWVNLESAGNAILSWTLFAGATEITGINGDTYTVQAGDAGKSLTWHVTCEDANGERTIITNAIAVSAAEEDEWWDPLVDTNPGSIDIDWAGGRIRLPGVSYSIAAARTANVIKTSGSGVDYVDLSGLGTSIGISASGVTPPTTGSFAMMALDDGDDGVPADEIIQLAVLSTPRASFASIKGGTNLFAPTTTATTPVNTPLRLSMRAKAGSTLNSYRGSVNGVMVAQGQNAETALPVVNRLCIGNRSAADRSWVAAGGTLSRLILINADLTDGAIDALLGA